MYSSKLRNKKRSLKLLGILAALITLMLIFIRREQEDISFSFDKDHFLRPTKRGMEVVVGHFIQNVESKTVITEGSVHTSDISCSF